MGMAMMIRFLPLIVVLAGCETNPVSIEAMSKAYAEAAKIRTFEADCTGPCKINYTDPRDRPTLALPTNGWDALRGVSKDLTGLAAGVAPWYAVGRVAIEGIKGAGGNDSSTTTSTTSTTTSTDTATTTTSSVDSHNVDSHNTATTTNDSHDVDSTHTPTVVVQPDPIVVGP
jgi:hypothetical protein